MSYISIPGVYKYNRVTFNISTRQSIMISVRMSSDLTVGLTRDPDSYTANTMYEIVIGGWTNTQSVIRWGVCIYHFEFLVAVCTTMGVLKNIVYLFVQELLIFTFRADKTHTPKLTCRPYYYWKTAAVLSMLWKSGSKWILLPTCRVLHEATDGQVHGGKRSVSWMNVHVTLINFGFLKMTNICQVDCFRQL